MLLWLAVFEGRKFEYLLVVQGKQRTHDVSVFPELATFPRRVEFVVVAFTEASAFLDIIESKRPQIKFFPKRRESRGFRNQKEGGAGFWPISPGSVSEAGAGAVAPIDVTPIQRCTSVKYTFGWSILGCTPRRGALRDTQRNLAPPAEGLSEIHKEIWDLFFLGLTTLLVFLEP